MIYVYKYIKTNIVYACSYIKYKTVEYVGTDNKMWLPEASVYEGERKYLSKDIQYQINSNYEVYNLVT